MFEILINYKNMISIQKESIHLVWTGLIVYNKNIDNTSHVILEMINSATKSITLVGYLIQNNPKKIFNTLYNIQLKKILKYDLFLMMVVNTIIKSERIGLNLKNCLRFILISLKNLIHYYMQKR